jgi:hypothetical protein
MGVVPSFRGRITVHKRKPTNISEMLQTKLKQHMIQKALLLISAIALTGCSGISTHQASKDCVRGIRVYQPKVYLFVGTQASKLVVLPDPEHAYDVKPWAFLAKTDFNIKVADGLPTEADVKLDSTAALALLQKAAELAADAAKGAAKAVADQELPGTFGLNPGVYTLSPSGGFQLVHVDK